MASVSSIVRYGFDDIEVELMRLPRLLWGVSGVTLGVYAIVQDLNIPLILQPQLFSALSYVCWAQVSRHPSS